MKFKKILIATTLLITGTALASCGNELPGLPSTGNDSTSDVVTPSNPSTGDGNTTETPSNPSTGDGNTTETPSNPSTGDGNTTETPSNPSTGNGNTTETPSNPSTGDGNTTETPSNPSTGDGNTTETPSNPSTGNGDTTETPINPSDDFNKDPIGTTKPSVDSTSDNLEILESGSGFEVAYAEFSPVASATSYNVYIKKTTDANYTKVDKELIRKYKNYYRVDVLGLAASKYDMKICAVKNNEEFKDTIISNIDVIAHDRSGFAFVGGTSSGAYNEDGTLKSDAILLYVDNNNKNTVSADIMYDKNITTFTGVQNIILAYKKKKETRPLCIRFIGNITDPSVLTNGDLYVDTCIAGLTIEGVGEDAVMNGFGIVLKNAKNVEVRNLGFMNCNSKEGDSVGLQQGNDHVWIHNNDFFYGHAGSDSDQAKGDGALDTKKSTYITHSYNHFYDTGKTHLNGNKDTTVNYISYHHNWYDHSDSRHPLVRVSSAIHVYNNYFDGVSKYGMIARMGASIFSEANYFYNTKKPHLISQQGTDILNGTPVSKETGGIIKSYADVYAGKTVASISHNDSQTNFDVYLASSRDEVVPTAFKTLVGGNSYSNFDTSKDMYSYKVDTAEVAMQNVKNYAGRLNGGDFKYSFEGKTYNQKDGKGVMQTVTADEYYGLDEELKSLIVNYTSAIEETYID